MKFQPVFVSSHLKPWQPRGSQKLTYMTSNMSGTNEKRAESEKSVVELMIRMYCQHKEHNHELCRECSELLDYALQQLDRCKFGISKPTCRKCPVHCYRQDMRARIRTVMRWSGPRMLYYHPLTAIRHLWRESRERNVNNNEK